MDALRNGAKYFSCKLFRDDPNEDHQGSPSETWALEFVVKVAESETALREYSSSGVYDGIPKV